MSIWSGARCSTSPLVVLKHKPALAFGSDFWLSSGLTSFRSLVAICGIVLLFSLPAHGQTPIAIQNPSFEVGGAALGAQGWNYGPVPSWTFTGPGPFGLTNVTTAPDGGTTVWSNGGTFSQDLGVALQAGQIYTASVYLSNRYDGLKPTASLSLLAGTKEICTASFAPIAPAFTFVQMTLACPTPAVIPAGNLTIKFGSDSRQILFDKVSLTSAPSIPPQLQNFTIYGGLRYCTLCDKSAGDDTVTGINLLAGLKVVLTQVDASQKPIGAVTFIMDANGNISGPDNITVNATNPLLFTVAVFTPTGTALGSLAENIAIDPVHFQGEGSFHVLIRMDQATPIKIRGVDWWTGA